jgi:hypothetical protein
MSEILYRSSLYDREIIVKRKACSNYLTVEVILPEYFSSRLSTLAVEIHEAIAKTEETK